MNQPDLLKPNLYTNPDQNGDIRLFGGYCRCGYRFFPMQHYGCEMCGAKGDELQMIQLAGKGELIASAVVHKHADEKRPTPFVVASIRLSDGPVIRTLLDYPANGPALLPGEPLVATLINITDRDGQPLRDLRFRPSANKNTQEKN